jgi:hypothetical protein
MNPFAQVKAPTRTGVGRRRRQDRCSLPLPARSGSLGFPPAAGPRQTRAAGFGLGAAWIYPNRTSGKTHPILLGGR